MGLIRVGLADPHPLFRTGLRVALQEHAGITVIGEAASLDELLRLAVTARPDVIVLDPRSMPAHSVKGLARTAPAAAIVLVAAEASEEMVARAIGDGANGYLLKDVEPDELVAAVRAAAEGALVFGRPLAGRLAAMLTSSRVDASWLGPLSHRERDVLELLKTGTGNAAIGRSLGVTAKTVANHISSMLAKLRVTSRTELIALAQGSGPDAPAPVVRLHSADQATPGVSDRSAS